MMPGNDNNAFSVLLALLPTHVAQAGKRNHMRRICAKHDRSTPP